jgi:murein DD-endopeptidase MepM/ murein hydrolase activator NlpD
MKKNALTLIIVPEASSRLHKLRLRLPGLYAFSAIALVAVLLVAGLAITYTRMVLQTASYSALVDENQALRVANKNLEVATRQLNTKIRGLEDLSNRIHQLMEDDTWNNRLGLVGETGVGGSVEDYPTATMLERLDLQDNIDLVWSQAAGLESDLRFVEEVAERRADQLLLTPSLWPVAGPIRSSYGRRRDPFTGESEMHRGLDIGAIYGTEVRAPANALVVLAQRQSAYGNLIVLDHGDGITTRYGHLAQFNIEKGNRVEKGDIIGFVGSTGRSTGPHLHYEVRLEERTLNPRNYLPVDPPSLAD